MEKVLMGICVIVVFCLCLFGCATAPPCPGIAIAPDGGFDNASFYRHLACINNDPPLVAFDDTVVVVVP